MVDVEISCFGDRRVKLLRSLRDRRGRDETGLFLIDGGRELKLCIEHIPDIVSEIFYHSKSLPKTFFDQIDIKLNVCTYKMKSCLFDKIAYKHNSDMVCVARQFHGSAIDIPASASFFLIVESVEKPGNLGAMLRIADGVGVDGLILCDAVTDLYNPNVVRASMGTLFSVPLFCMNSIDAISFLKQRGIQIVVGSPRASASLFDVSFNSSVAVVVGSESCGVSDVWLSAADILLSIPMYGAADSLNVSSASAIILYEVKKQIDSL